MNFNNMKRKALHYLNFNIFIIKNTFLWTLSHGEYCFAITWTYIFNLMVIQKNNVKIKVGLKAEHFTNAHLFLPVQTSNWCRLSIKFEAIAPSLMWSSERDLARSRNSVDIIFDIIFRHVFKGENET